VSNNFVLTGLFAASKIEISKERIWITAVFAKDNCRPTYISSIFYLPEANILFTAGNKACIIDRTEFYASNIKFRGLLDENLWLESLGANF